jgi:hypothetical protein
LNRRTQAKTVGRETFDWRAISPTDLPAAAPRTMRARSTSWAGAVRARAIRSNSARSSLESSRSGILAGMVHLPADGIQTS